MSMLHNGVVTIERANRGRFSRPGDIGVDGIRLPPITDGNSANGIASGFWDCRVPQELNRDGPNHGIGIVSDRTGHGSQRPIRRGTAWHGRPHPGRGRGAAGQHRFSACGRWQGTEALVLRPAAFVAHISLFAICSKLVDLRIPRSRGRSRSRASRLVWHRPTPSATWSTLVTECSYSHGEPSRQRSELEQPYGGEPRRPAG